MDLVVATENPRPPATAAAFFLGFSNPGVGKGPCVIIKSSRTDFPSNLFPLGPQLLVQRDDTWWPCKDKTGLVNYKKNKDFSTN